MSSSTEMTIASYTASPSMPSQRLKTRSNFPFRTRSTQRPSLLTGTRTTSSAHSSNALSTASMESSSWTSGAFPSAESPSNNKAIFIACSSCSRTGLRGSRCSARRERGLASSGSASRARPGEVDSLPRSGKLQTALNQLVVSDSSRPRGFRQTRVLRWIGKNSRQRVHLEDVRATGSVEADVDSRPVSAAKHAERIERNALNRRLKLAGDTRRALEDVERILGTIPDELGVVAVNRERAFGQRLEIHSNDGEHRRTGGVAQHRAREFLAGQKLLDQNRLVVVLEEKFGLAEKLVAVAAQIAVGDPLRRSFVDGLDENGERQLPGNAIQIGELFDEHELRRWNAVEGQRLLGS